MTGVPIVFVNDITLGGKNPSKRLDLAPGSAEFLCAENSKPTNLHFICPCGCGERDAIPIDTAPSEYAWHWNGDMERPTLTPSLQRTGGCNWHGYLTDGVFVPC